MRMVKPLQKLRRRAAVLPMVTICLVALIGCVALAVDIGLIADARTEMQSHVDAAVMAGVRELEGVSADNSKDTALNTAKNVVKLNNVFGKQVADADIKDLQIGVYRYDSVAQKFSPQYVAPGLSENYGAVTMTLTKDQPLFFAKIFGFTKQAISVKATAVARPRDIAMILDFSGSMGYSSEINWDDGGTQAALNPDPNFPRFGPWSLFPQQLPPGTTTISPVQRSTSSSNKAPNNTTRLTVNGPPIVHDFFVKVDDGQGLPTSVTFSTRAWKNGIAADNDTPAVAVWTPTPGSLPASGNVMPAPAELANQNIAEWTNASNFGDKFPLKVSPPGSNAAPVPGDYAATVHDYVNFLVANPAEIAYAASGVPAPPTPVSTLDTNAFITPPPGASQELNYSPGAPFNATQPALTNTFRDGTGNDVTRRHVWWETNGYGPNFKGYTMGPGYWGKTFYMWPPDPRTPATTAPPAANVVSTAGSFYQWGDWRRRFFVNVNTTGGTSAGNPLTDNARLWRADVGINSTNYGRWVEAGTNWRPNYDNIIKWIKSGPQVFPPSMRSGRVLYYSAIPDTIPTTGGTLDQVFWRNYINYVLGFSNYTENSYHYGRNLTMSVNSTTGTGSTDACRQCWPSGTSTPYGDHIRVTPANRVFGQDNADNGNNDGSNNGAGSGSGDDPYMSYHDNPVHPRARMWFGPASMTNFVTEAHGEAEIMAGTTHQSQCWQVKVGAQSALEDIQRNHPNDLCSLIFFSGSDRFNSYKFPRQTLSDQYDLMKKLLWYPHKIGGLKPLPDPVSSPPLATGYLSDNNAELRPYNDWGSTNVDIIPHAAGNTNYEMGLMVAFNQFSARSGTVPMAGGKGRIGASKLVLFETDGRPNTNVDAGGGFTGTQPNLCQFEDITSDNTGAGQAAAASSAITVVKRMCMANSADTTFYPKSYSNGGKTAKVHAIAFGDLFENGGALDALQILATIQAEGNTGSSSATTIESFKIIVGDFNNRITNLRLAYERIMQGDVQLSLIE